MALNEDKLVVLFLEDSIKHKKLIRTKLSDGLNCCILLDSAQTKDEYLNFIRNKSYDLILADYALPEMSGEEALDLANTICPDVPFIFVSDALGEDIAVELLKKGAADFVLNNRLERLIFAVKRALKSKMEKQKMKEDEAHLKTVNESLKTAQRMAKIGSFDWDIVNDKMFGSDEVYRIFELEPDSVDAKLFSGISFLYMDEGDKERNATAIENALKGVAPYDVEYWLNLPGKRKYINVRGNVTRDEMGKPIYMSGTYQDLTERKMAEIAITRLNENLKEAQSIARIGGWEWDIQNNTLLCSPQAYAIMGLDPDTPMYKNISFNYVSEEDKQKIVRAQEEALLGKAPYHVEYEFKRPDGKTIFLESRGKVRFDTDGKAIFMSGYMQDITERKLAEQAEKKEADFEWMMLSLAQDFINTPLDDLDDALTNALGLMGEFCEADRVAIYRYDWENQQIIHAYEWDKKPEYYMGEKMKYVPFQMLAEILDCNHQGMIYNYARNGDVFIPFNDFSSLSNSETGFALPLMKNGQLFATLDFSSYSRTFCEFGYESIMQIFAEMISNVLQRIDNERELQEIVALNKLVLNSINDGVGLFKRDGTTVFVNRILAQRFGIVEQEYIGRKMAHFLPEEKYGDLHKIRMQKLEEVFETGKMTAIEDTREGRWFYNRFYPVFKDGEVAAVTFFSTDVTDRKIAEVEEKARFRIQSED